MLLGAWVFVVGPSIFAIVILMLMFVTAVPRVIAMFRGQLDPRGSGLVPVQRAVTFAAYLALILIGVAGAAATYVERAAA